MALNRIERDCQDVLVMLQDLLSPGHKLTNNSHTEVCGHVRDVIRKLANKEYGCVLGIHAGRCQCKE